MRTPKPGDIDRGTIQSWNVAYERRLPLDVAVDVAYVGARGDGGYMFLDINAPQTIGGGNHSRPYALNGPLPRPDQHGERPGDALSLAAGRRSTGPSRRDS